MDPNNSGGEENQTESEPARPAIVAKGRRRRIYSKAGARRRRYRGSISVGDVLGGSFGMYFGNLPLFTLITLIVFSPLIVIRTTLQGELRDAAYLLSILNTILSQIATAAVIYGVFRKLKKKKADLGRCLAVGLERLFPLLGAAIVIGIAAGLPMIIPMLMLLAGSPILGSLFMFPAFIIFMMIYVSLAMTAPNIVVESTGVFDGIGRSMSLTRGNRWRIFLVLFTIGIIQFVVNYIFNYLLGPGLAAAGGETPAAVILIRLVVTVAFSALNAIAIGLTYYHLKVKVEGADEMELAAVFD